ncbi:MAG: hypothetical protein RQ733_05705 [Methyloprofundus sp.]|nr:hypothetical protein [Methyloprofundus sp.]MDT8425451.1 hypothetical protein [Methyloprofundus sp.]
MTVDQAAAFRDPSVIMISPDTQIGSGNLFAELAGHAKVSLL